MGGESEREASLSSCAFTAPVGTADPTSCRNEGARLVVKLQDKGA